MLALMRTTESLASSAMACASINILSPPVAGNAAHRSAWSAAPSARFEGAIRLEVIIEDWCIGCASARRNCPYGNINLHPFEVMIERS